jgi:N6-L-threonylcarbamoyladenine synthase
MKILGIETSCDETCAAVVSDGRRVLSSVVATQVEIHRKYGGVVPEIASRAHIEALVPVVAEALQEAGTPCSRGNLSLQGTAADAIDAVAVVHRPGLIGSLLLGLAAAKTLAWLRGVPLVGVNHIEGHIYAACLEREALPFPCVSLIVSGGHTSLYRSEGPADHRLLGATTDDAAGEAFDKVASLLGLEYPGGPSVDRAAEGGNPKAVPFPRSWLGPDSFDFSFSGLKTAVLYHVRGKGAEAKRRATHLAPEEMADVAASFQEAVVDVLVGKTLRAAEASGVDRVIVGGGVAANRRLRARLQEEADRAGIEVLLPEMRFCTDNAAMVAGLAYHYARAGRFADLDLEARAG